LRRGFGSQRQGAKLSAGADNVRVAWLTWIAFESPVALGVALLPLLFVLVVLWRRRGRAQPLLVGLATAAALFVLQVLVVTQREHAVRLLDPIERDLLQARTGALAAALAPGFDADGLARDAFLEQVERSLHRVRIRWLERWRFTIADSSSDQFTATAEYLAEVNTEGIAHTPRSAWELRFVRTPAGWRLGGTRCLHIDGVADPWRARP
jgi:hypothetical protein